MKTIIEKYLPNYAPPEPAGGAGAPPAGEPEGGVDPSPPAGAPPAGGETPPAGGDLYRPNGLPDTMFGNSNNETMDKMANALNGYRTADAKRSSVPKEASEYKLGDISEDLKPFLGSLEADPIWDSTQAMALKHGFTQTQFSGFVTELVGEWLQGGVFSEVINVKQEHAELLPETHSRSTPEEQSAAIQSRITENLDWVENVLVSKTENDGGLSKEDGEFIVQAFGDRAAGHRVMEFLRGRLDNSGPNPLGGGGGDIGGDDFVGTGPTWDPSHPEYDATAANAQLERLKAKANSLGG